MSFITLRNRLARQPQHVAPIDFAGLGKGLKILWHPGVGPVDLVTERIWTPAGSAKIAPTLGGRAFLFDGASSYYSHTGYPELTGNVGTFFMWCPIVGSPDDFGHVLLGSASPGAVAFQVNESSQVQIFGGGVSSGSISWFNSENRSLVLSSGGTAATCKAFLDGKNTGLTFPGTPVAWGAGNKTITLGRYPSGALWDFKGSIVVAGFTTDVWSAAEAQAFHENPWTLFKSPDRRIWIEPGPVELVVSGITQTNTVSDPYISLGGTLFAFPISQTNSASSGQITRTQDLTLSNATQGNSVSKGSTSPYGRLRSLLRSLPVNTWVKVNTSKYVDCQMPLADRPINYPNAWDHVKIVIPWSSFAFDHTRGHLLLWGGGHANYTGNQLYQWHADTGEWSLSCLPSKLTADANMNVVDGLAPQSSHTYQNNFWLKQNDMFGTFGGAATPTGSTVQENNGGTQRRVGPWLYDLTKTDPNKVGGSNGSGMDISRLGLNAWQHRRDNVPTGTVGTNTYPIDYTAHSQQAAVSISKDGKDYVVFTMDSVSTLPSWYRYEFGNVRAGEDDQCVYLGRTTQSNTIVTEGWMVYDTKRELVYRNGYNKNVNYTPAELVAKKPWVAGVAETPIRLVKSSDSTTFTMNPVNDDCPYGATYDATNDCIWLWAGAFAGSNSDPGAVYRINIPEYDSSTGWANTTWTVDEIIPAGDRPVGHHQQPVLGKIKHVPEVEAFLILDRAEPDGSLDSASVWAFKTAQIPGDLLVASLDQGNSANTGAIAVEHTLSTNALAQNSSVEAVSISQEGALFASDIDQTNSLNEASLSQIQNISVSGLTQSNSVPDVEISKVVTVNLGSDNLSQGNLVDEIAVTKTLDISVSNVDQENTGSSAAISQERTLVTVGISQTNILPSGEIAKDGTLVVLSVEQGNALQAVAVVQEQILVGLNISQSNELSSGSATQTRILVCPGITQGNAASTGAIGSSTNDLVAVSITQINACPSRGIALNQIIIAANIAQSNFAAAGAITALDGPLLVIDSKYIAYAHRKNYTAKYGD